MEPDCECQRLHGLRVVCRDVGSHRAEDCAGILKKYHTIQQFQLLCRCVCLYHCALRGAISRHHALRLAFQHQRRHNARGGDTSFQHGRPQHRYDCAGAHYHFLSDKNCFNNNDFYYIDNHGNSNN